ncbi:MAG: CoA activase, partial [Desulfobacteraceae bacterium]
MPGPSNVIGIDVGSVAVSAVELDLRGAVSRTAYEIHRGRVETALQRILKRFDLSGAYGTAATSSCPAIVNATARCDMRIAVISGARRCHRNFGSILLVGGEKFGLFRFDEQGNYLSFKANTSCAAGTGSFLDQQAQRLNLSGIGELSEIAYNNSGSVPKIASRCSVFVKTDLIHAQQEGYGLAEICDGLCHGLARSIYDTLFAGEQPSGPIVFAGGVSLNRAVIRHLQSMTGQKILVHPHAHLFGAIGAALHLLSEHRIHDLPKLKSPNDILIRATRPKNYFHGPLQLTLSGYPDFDGIEKYEFRSEKEKFSGRVEVDLYENLRTGTTIPAYLGVDIGSTSTKAVLLSEGRAVLAGLYTRTAGRPLEALQSVLAAIDDLLCRKKIELSITGAGATGSGRKFIGSLMGADLIVDEITAHARAAYQLNPEVDTIIEIGGQDSKFTTLKNGSVTCAIMNTVCAAGTGSFIEEQGNKLDCPLIDFSKRTERRRSPIASDRCTVFMERDINHYLSEGYTVDEVLAAVLHAVCENYLTRVAVEGRIGKTVFFQGATAKNRALVAAFEQRLEKPIHVSKYCHLTGALGAALIVADEGVAETGFRGIGLHRKSIPLRFEVCGFCANHCKITVAEIDGEKVAYGFLCGRDYETRKHVERNDSGFDLLRERKKAFFWKPKKKAASREPVIGIPAALHIYEDMAFWRHFFDALGIETITSEDFRDAVSEGKHAAGVEFCAPMSAFYGHVNHLKEKCDFVFVPSYLEKRSGKAEGRRQYCYCTQYAAPLASALFDENCRSRCLTPLIHYLYSPFHTKAQLYRMLKSICTRSIGFAAVSVAYDRAATFRQKALRTLKERFREASGRTSDRTSGPNAAVDVVLLGRPYTVLCPSMNKGIPDLFASLGVKTFFQDMLSCGQKDVRSVASLLSGMHWNYAAKILGAAAAAARTEGVYPVLLTSFKCSPDSFVMEYFRKLMEAHDKPYLVLQLDEHDSRVGYETRIEAAVRSFRNHRLHREARPGFPMQETPAPATPAKRIAIGYRETSLSGKTLFIPNWDESALRLIVSALRRDGIDARLLQGSATAVQKSLRYNTGQCIPIHLIAQEFADAVEESELDPSKAVLWLGASEIACNIHLYPAHIRSLIDAYGSGMEKAGIYAGSMSMR